MTAARRLLVVVVLFGVAAACSDDDAAQSTQTLPTASTNPPTICVTTPATEGRVITVTIDDVVGGFGRLGLRAPSGLTPGIVRVEVTGDEENALPLGVSILRDESPVGMVNGVGAGETCGIDVEVSEGVYHVTDGVHDVEFTVDP